MSTGQPPRIGPLALSSQERAALIKLAGTPLVAGRTIGQGATGRVLNLSWPEGGEAGLVVKVSKVKQAEQEALSAQSISRLLKGTEIRVSEVRGVAVIGQSGETQIHWPGKSTVKVETSQVHQVASDPLASPGQPGEKTVLTLMTKIPGMDIQGHWHDLTEEQSIKIASQVANLFKQSARYLPQRQGVGFHWADDAHLALPYRDGHQSFVAWTTNQLVAMAKLPGTQGLAGQLQGLYQEAEDLFRRGSTQTTLWDMADRNIMVDGNFKVNGLIDQGGLTTGDPAVVVSFIDSMLRSDGFAHVDAYVEQWERELGFDHEARQRLAVMQVVDFASTWIKDRQLATGAVTEDGLREMMGRAKMALASPGSRRQCRP